MPARSLIVFAFILCSCQRTKFSPAGQTVFKDSLHSVRAQTTDKKIWPKVVYDTLKFSEGALRDNTTKQDSLNELNFYTKFIQSKNLNKDQLVMEKYSSQRIRYLGMLNDLDNKHTYHVLTNFTRFGINGYMLSPRGHSMLVFVDRDQKKVAHL